MILTFGTENGYLKTRCSKYVIHDMHIATKKFPKNIPNRINVRGNEDAYKYVKEMVGTLNEDPQSFLAYNRGITIVVKSVEYDTEKNLIKANIPDDRLYGIADGGHTARAIAESPSDDAFVRVTLIVTQDRDFVRATTRYRNSGKNVRADDLASMNGDFDIVRQILIQGHLPDDDNHIAYRSGDKETRDLTTITDVARVVAAFSSLSLDYYRRGVFEEAYKDIKAVLHSAVNVIQHITNDKLYYNSSNFGMIAGGIRLYEAIDRTLNEELDIAGATALLGATKKNRLAEKKRLLFLAPAEDEKKNCLSYLYTYWIFQAFRAFLIKSEKGENHLRWYCPKDDIVEFFEDNKKKVFELTAKVIQEHYKDTDFESRVFHTNSDAYHYLYNEFKDWRDEYEESLAGATEMSA